jgi:hypothetical protein
MAIVLDALVGLGASGCPESGESDLPYQQRWLELCAAEPDIIPPSTPTAAPTAKAASRDRPSRPLARFAARGAVPYADTG